MNQLIKEFNRENLKPLVFIAVTLLLLAATAYPQRKFGGKVVEVVDGKTAVIQVPTGGRVTVVLQFIEIPEREQPLYQTVRQHLETLVLGKTVEFLPRRILVQGSVGQIFLDGLDVSRQMLRDGAAWYALPERSAQDAQEREIYLGLETQARSEKRGVWGVENIKPAWEFRADKQKAAAEIEKAKTEVAETQKPFEINRENPFAIARKPKLAPPPQMPLDMWSSVKNSAPVDVKTDNGGLVRDFVPGTGVRYVMTAGDFYEFKGAGSGAGATARFESRSMFVTADGSQLMGSGFVIGFLTEADNLKFADASALTLSADGQKFNLGNAKRLPQRTPGGELVMLLYKIDQKVLEKISDAKNVDVKIGKYSGRLDDGYQLRIKNLLAVTSY